jgi:hypothetical protein
LPRTLLVSIAFCELIERAMLRIAELLKLRAVNEQVGVNEFCRCQRTLTV